MKQIELFEAGALTRPAKPAPLPPPPAPERVRRYLREDVAYLQGAEIPPWPERELARRAGEFAALADELGPEESAEWKKRWRSEIDRLRAARAAAA